MINLMSQQSALVARMSTCILGYTEHSTATWFEKGDCPTTLSIGAASPQELQACFGLHSVRRILNIRMCPKKGNIDDERTKGHDLWGPEEDVI